MKKVCGRHFGVVSFIAAITVTASSIFAQATRPSVDTSKAPSLPAVDLSKEHVLYVVGYAHLDTQWRWAYPQVIREYIPATLRDNFALFEKYPHYVFNFSGARRYEMMREYYPEDYARLKQYVAAGKWFPCGSSMDENDANVPSAESFIRHVLYGNRYFRSEFGMASTEFMLPDCFGFPAALPTMLAHCGIRGFSTQKLTWGSAVGIPFKVGVWEGVDGSSVMAALDPGAYSGTVKENLANSPGWSKRVANNGEKSGIYADYHYFGTGDRGGAPNEESVKKVEESIMTSGGLLRVISGPADWLFRAISPAMEKGLPRYKGELLLTEHSSGSITSQAYMKRWNRKNELLADSAERASVGAMWLAHSDYPSAAIYQAWDLVLGSQMHDILPGTSLPKAYEYSWNDELLAANEFQTVLKQGVGAVASTLDTRATGVPLVVYNPLSIEREDVVEASVAFPKGTPDAVTVFGPDGIAVPTQVVGTAGAKTKILFLAKLPSVGFATFDVRPVVNAVSATGAVPLRVDEKSLENGRYKVTLNPAGDVASIIDKVNGDKELLSAPARLVFQYEKPQDFPAWNMDWADQKKPPRAAVTGPAKVQIVETGPVRVTLEVERESEGSKFVQQIRLAAGAAGDRVEYATTIDWRTKESALKQEFPLAVSNPNATYDLQVGAIERGNNDAKKYEVPAHKWFDLTDSAGAYGVSILNDSKFGSDKPSDNLLRLTLLYTPGVRGEYQDQGSQDFGRHEMLYAISGHNGDWRDGKTAWAAARLNQPLMAFHVDVHEGNRKSLSLFQVSGAEVAISAIKKTEEGGGVIVRLRELTGKPVTGIRVSAKDIGGIAAARQVDGQEREVAGAETIVDGGQLVTDMPGFGLKAFEISTPLSQPAGTADGAPRSSTDGRSVPVTLPFDTDVVSSTANPKDGAMDSAGKSYPAEQFAKSISSGGVTFAMGPSGDGQLNAIAARGQMVSLPSNQVDRLYVLAASSDGDVDATFDASGTQTTVRIQSWSGYIGQYDNRLWGGTVPELAFSWSNPLVGLEPGYVKPAEVAWYCSHLHNPAKGNEFYHYSYIFAYELKIPKGASSVTLPNDPRVKILAMSGVVGGYQPVQPAAPVFDTLADRQQDMPGIMAPMGEASDTRLVAISLPLYHRPGSVRYTTDGTQPTSTSLAYTAPIVLSDSKTVSARAFDAAGVGGPVATLRITVNDRTAPKVTAATAVFNMAHLSFSEPVDQATAESVANYTATGGAVVSAKLDADGLGVTLVLSGTVSGLRVKGVKDLSPAGNTMADATFAIATNAPVYTLENYVADGKSGLELRPDGLPVKANQPWTMNMFVKMSEEPETRTMIAGFGNMADKTGQGRYMTKFSNGVHHWTSNTDVESSERYTKNAWQMLTTTYDGKVMRLYSDGRLIGQREAQLPADESIVNIAPTDVWEHSVRFKGELRKFTIWNEGLSSEAVKLLHAEGMPKP